MTVKATFLFDSPQAEVASLIVERMSISTATSILTGFATPDGVNSIAAPIIARPLSIADIVIGAATYPGFEALDDLLAAGVPAARLHVHLGHTQLSGGRKNPFKRFHPMLHSKLYYMELGNREACALVGSHNVTSFALRGLNGEAAVLLEGGVDSFEFQQIRDHIAKARDQSVTYSSDMKEGFAWWTREFIDGMRAEVALPQESTITRTIIIFATVKGGGQPKLGDHLYFEIPSGIEQIESLKTETHLFIFDTLPSSAGEAIDRIANAKAAFNCMTLGAENKQGNREVTADWRVDRASLPVLMPVANRTFRPQTVVGMQQVRAEVRSSAVGPFEYYFDRPRVAWEPVLSSDVRLLPAPLTIGSEAQLNVPRLASTGASWSLVTGLRPRADAPIE